MRSGAHIVEVAQSAGVTRGVVQRWLTDPELHVLWTTARLDQLRTHHLTSIHEALTSGVASRQELRLKANAAYLWFQRNEPEILEGLIPRSLEDKQLPLWK
ncbi:hypothetical protein AZ34_02360 [Hylemonella gracilis str. Niagara R]|uniref:Uncharacterized protein n=2 Tax=Hylemonella gracilis TaxID=80880 RepID=A0A016XNG1_9BURK|nr:hypothetical protein AZ34_02360 [Hylemonella gracilis str. Niagara R]